MKEHVIRLLPGEDVLVGIDHYCFKHNIQSAYIASCVGSLSMVSFRKGYERTVFVQEGSFEIMSLNGTVSIGGNHIHMAVSKADFSVIGGHIKSGCIVRSTAEIVIVELENHELRRSKTEAHGYKELRIVRINTCSE